MITNTKIEVDTEFTVTWSAPPNNTDNNSTKYRLEWRKNPITNITKVRRAENINETRFRISGLEHDVEYVVKLYAVYRHGYSEPDVRRFKTKPKVGEYYGCTLIHVNSCGGLPHQRDGNPFNQELLKFMNCYLAVIIRKRVF